MAELEPDTPRPASRRGFWWLFILSLLNVFPFAIIGPMLPHLKRRYDEYGLSLPSATKTIFKFQDDWWLVAVQFIGLLLAFCFAYQFPRHRRLVVILWILLLLILPTLFNLTCFMALLSPELKLQDALRK